MASDILAAATSRTFLQQQKHDLLKEIASPDMSIVWGGDDIGLDSDRDAIVTLRDREAPNSRFWHVSLDVALCIAYRLDDHGLSRMTETLAFADAQGYLSEADHAAWNSYRARLGQH